ncbi:hypothetical protein [Clostridium sp. B9]|uniref:hypothetical protein n=1 Tax=Clostridium sp. B9 TaxID=3423224 RepID=UPI003D2EF8AC
MKGSSGPVKAKKKKKSMAYTLSLYMGWSSIFAALYFFLIGLPFAIPGLIAGYIAVKKHNEGKFPLILNIIGFVLTVITWILFMKVPLQ